jgi:hypothetical protein
MRWARAQKQKIKPIFYGKYGRKDQDLYGRGHSP